MTLIIRSNYFVWEATGVLENMRIGFDASITNRSSGILFFFVGDFFFLILDELINIACIVYGRKKKLKHFIFPVTFYYYTSLNFKLIIITIEWF